MTSQDAEKVAFKEAIEGFFKFYLHTFEYFKLLPGMEAFETDREFYAEADKR